MTVRELIEALSALPPELPVKSRDQYDNPTCDPMVMSYKRRPWHEGGTVDVFAETMADAEWIEVR